MGLLCLVILMFCTSKILKQISFASLAVRLKYHRVVVTNKDSLRILVSKKIYKKLELVSLQKHFMNKQDMLSIY